MENILLLGIILIELFTLVIFKFDYGEPAFLVVSSTLLSVFIAYLNLYKWGGSLGGKTVILILLSTIFFIIGSMIAKICFKVTPKKTKSLKNSPILVKKIIVFFTNLFIIFTILFYIVSLINAVGGLSQYSVQGFINMMNTYRAGVKEGIMGVSSLSIQLFNFSGMLAYVYAYLYIYNYILFKIKNKSYLFPVLLYLPLVILTSSRVYFLYLIVGVFSIYYIFYTKKNKKKVSNKLKMTFKIFLIILITLFSFGSLANLVGRNTKHTIYDQISIYLGGPIVSYDIYLKQSKNQTHEVSRFGEESLIGLYDLTNKIGLTNYRINRHLPFVNFGENWGNVYTAMRRYIQDFGLNWALLLQGFLGFLFGFFYIFVKNKSLSSCWIIIYGILVYPTIFFSIDDVLLSNFIGYNTILQILYILIIYKGVIKNKRFLNNESVRVNEKKCL